MKCLSSIIKLETCLFHGSGAITDTAEIISRIILTENANFREKEQMFGYAKFNTLRCLF